MKSSRTLYNYKKEVKREDEETHLDLDPGVRRFPSVVGICYFTGEA